MAYDYRLHGHLHYPDAPHAQQALAALDPLLANDDPDFAATIEDQRAQGFTLQGPTLAVDLHLHGPGDFWFSLEALAETLTETATHGYLDGEHEIFEGEGPERFEAAGGVDESA